MQDSGFPAKISECYRSPERQKKLKHEGRSKAGPWQSPHQYFEAVDIIHPSLGWDVSPEYWEKLSICVKIVANKYGVELNHGHHWAWRDSAHIEIADWRAWARQIGKRSPNSQQLWERFEKVLPKVAKEYSRR
jgi:hypothetical protein